MPVATPVREVVDLALGSATLDSRPKRGALIL